MSRRGLVLATAAALALAAPAAARTPDRLVTLGNHLYGQYCLTCHGPNGSGVPPSSAVRGGFNAGRVQDEITAVAPSLRGVGALAADFYLRTGYMPLERPGVQPTRSRVLFSDRELRALTAYVASLGPGPPVPSTHPARGNVSDGQKAFTELCAGCHQVVGEGGYVTDAIAPPLDEATPTQIAEAVRIGPYVMPRFDESQLPDRELDSLIRYVQYAKSPDDSGGWPLGHLGPVPEGLVAWFVAATAVVGVCMTIGARVGRRG